MRVVAVDSGDGDGWDGGAGGVGRGDFVVDCSLEGVVRLICLCIQDPVFGGKTI